jgi:hypothetical protein
LGIFQENQLCGGEKVEEQVDRCEAKWLWKEGLSW